MLNLNFTLFSNKWSLGKWKGNYFVCLEFSFPDSSYYTAFSLSPHSVCFVANREKNYKFQKLHYPLEQDYGLKKISCFQKVNVQVCIFDKDHIWLKVCFKGSLYNQENGDISIFAFPLANMISFCYTLIQLYCWIWKPQ